ncbi:carboxylesterase/lipase family protein [Microbacterium resistens]|nr:carboxylesterase/lipase family protein [Microbacterium resistens]
MLGVIEADVQRFSGMPFARVARRFAPPSPAAWDDPFDASVWGPAPWQPLPAYEELGAELAEDCLNANIWAPMGAEDLPVIVWVYGGGWEQGSNASPSAAGDILAGTGRVVVVSLNYRVTALGWGQFAHHGGGLGAATNLGLQDIVVGLEWVHRNIARFGGDPARVTVLGESAGGFSLSALLGSRRGRRTFRRLAAFSGAASRIVPLSAAARLGDDIIEALGHDPLTCTPESLIEAQRRVTPTDIGIRNGATPRSLGVVDDSRSECGMLDAHPLTAITAGATRDIDLWFGSTRDEAALFALHAPDAYVGITRTQLIDQVRSWTDGQADPTRLVNGYERSDEDGSPRERLITDWVYRLPAARGAMAQAASGGRAFLSVVGRADGEPAGHAVDVPALFGRVPDDGGPEARLRQAEVTAAVLRFAETGDPGWDAVDTSPLSQTLGPDPWDSTASHERVLSDWHEFSRP